ncbi:MAG: TetR/AcrR family transcriptional regulator [Deltaproteobacteria bacterium]|nr:TetR/AcrR family transcriptional regulator [Deltaproteobacteria bacterium]
MAAALACFVERGFHGTAMPQIAERAEVAAGTIYHYFPSKEALVNELYRKWKSVVMQRVFKAFPQGVGAREQFRVMWLEIIAFARDDPDAFMFIETHNHASYLDDESVALDRNLKDFARSMLGLAQSQGLVKPLDATLLMELVFGAFVGMMRAHTEGRLVLDDEVVAQAERACWDAIAVHPGRGLGSGTASAPSVA